MTDQRPLSHPNRTGFGQPQTRSLGSHDHESIAFLLKKTRPWLLVIGVLMATGAGLALVRGFAVRPILAPLFSDRPGEVITATIAVRYLAFGAVCAGIAVMFFRYSSSVTRYIETPTIGALTETTYAQKSLWKFSGIAAIGLIALYLILRTVALGVIPGQDF